MDWISLSKLLTDDHMTDQQSIFNTCLLCPFKHSLRLQILSSVQFTIFASLSLPSRIVYICLHRCHSLFQYYLRRTSLLIYLSSSFTARLGSPYLLYPSPHLAPEFKLPDPNVLPVFDTLLKFVPILAEIPPS